MKLAWLACLDATKKGDVTRSGIVWSYDAIGSTVSTVAIADGLVYAADFDGDLHCLDAETGQLLLGAPGGRTDLGLAAGGRRKGLPGNRGSPVLGARGRQGA